MNATNVLTYGHQTVIDIIEELPRETWYQPGVCGVWSVKDIVAHLASFEHVLVDVLHKLLGKDVATPALDALRADYVGFNDAEVEKRRTLTAQEAWREYEETYRQTVALLAQIPAAQRRQNGLLPWYGAEYDLEDFIAYSFYGHKREHSAQLAVYRDRIEAEREHVLAVSHS